MGAAAQAPDPEDDAVAAGAAAAEEEVVVTGSRIRGTPEDAALPVMVIGREDLAKRGSPSTLDMIKSLPGVGAVIGESNQYSAFAQGQVGAGSINLRGLGGLRTLTLFNGRRTVISPGSGTLGVDTNLIPLAAVSRVEVLKDGAAAIYGSDAIGGVVNFITRQNFEGWEVQGDYRLVRGSDGDWGGSVAYGYVDSRSNVFLSVGYQHRSELSTLERSWDDYSNLENPVAWSVLGNPSTFLPRSAANTPVAGVQRDANCAAVGGVVAFTGTTPACLFNYVPFTNFIEEESRVQVYGELNYRFDSGTRFHVEALYAQTDLPSYRFSPSYPPTQGPNGPGSAGAFTAPATNPGVLAALQQAGLSAGVIAATNNVSLTLWRPLGNGGNAGTDGMGQEGSRKYDIVRVSASLNGTFSNGIGWDIALTYSDSSNRQRTTDVLTHRLQAALNGLGGPNCTGVTPGANGCQWFNPFSNGYAGNPALGLSNPGYIPANANDPALVAWLFDTLDTNNYQTQFVADFALDGEFDWELPGGKIGWAVGAQYRQDIFDSALRGQFQDARANPCPTPGVTTCAVRTGPYIFLGAGTPQHLESEVYAGFAELNVPILETLTAQLAVRYEDYGGLTGSTTNPKLALKWQVFDSFALRGSIGTTFRGPLASNRSTSVVTALAAITAASGGFKSVDTVGDPAIGPETATTFNVGGIFQDFGLRVMVDYWKYSFKDQIVNVPANPVASSVAINGGAGFVNCAAPLRFLVTFANNDTCTQGVTIGNDIARVRAPFVNGPGIETSGIDFAFDYMLEDVGGGTLTLGADVSYVIDYTQEDFFYQSILVQAGFEAAGFTNYDRAVQTISKVRGSGFVDYAYDIHNFRLTVNHIGGATDNRAPIFAQNGATTSCTVANATCIPVTLGLRVKSFTTLDFTYRVELPMDVTVTASAFNIFDRDPSAARLEYGYDPFIGNPYGRSFKVSFAKRF